ncbi:zinc-binding dehydrogenase [Nocardia kruczakiae]|nr:zinc-binding dehydrogenase [Nocardia kruczakiae]
MLRKSRLSSSAGSTTIDTVFPLDDIVAAHHPLEAGKHISKIVVTI